MADRIKVLAVSCGLLDPKKDYGLLSKRNLYLNYGLLGLCTILNNKGYEVKQFQGEYKTPRELVDHINNSEFNLNQINFPIIISLISFLSISWCAEFTKIIKTEYGLRCIAGGKYVVDGNVNWLKKKLPYVDSFIEGAGEEKIESVICAADNHTSLRGFIKEKNRPYSKLNYTLLDDHMKYNPCIELARGCGHGCVYCADGLRRQSKVKDPWAVVSELHEIQKEYDYESFLVYFQMATFNVSFDWLSQFQDLLEKDDILIPWRCTTRIDVMKPEIIPILRRTGCKVIDFGLESASPRQLIAMKKSSDPVKYLLMAHNLIKACTYNGIYAKLNILLSAGEDTSTINETVQWLSDNKKYFKGVSVNCETVYGPYTDISKFKKCGASLANSKDLLMNGYASLNLSPSIDARSAKRIALHLSQKFMSARDYFELKKAGYFSRYYTYDDFLQDINKCDANQLPFHL